MSVIEHSGPARTGVRSGLLRAQIVLVSYDTLVRDVSLFKRIVWDKLIVDEAQAIKNPSTKRSTAIKAVPRTMSIAMTGTPVENQLTDLWSIIDFCVPGLLGSLQQFESQHQGDPKETVQLLAQKVAPLILRRHLLDVVRDLPEKIESFSPLRMDRRSAEAYETVRAAGTSERHGALGLVSSLRQFCCHPATLSDRYGTALRSLSPDQSPKYQRLVEILDEVIASGEKCILFSPFHRFTDLAVDDLGARFGVWSASLDGRTPAAQRQSLVDVFSRQPGSAILVLGPRAAGVGLNIVAANHVIHYCPEWNPAVMDQATARAHRIGTTARVRVHYLYYADTIEEVMMERLARKRVLADAALSEASEDVPSDVDLMRALSLSPAGGNYE
ncbi:MAG: DEAD/DEAH box helicase [Anaerolineae bacterium]